MENTTHLDIEKVRSIERLDGILDNVVVNINQRGSTPRFPTGLEDLDEQIWGLHKKELLVLGARPAEGKTSLGLQIAWSLSNSQKRVLFLSLEMSKEQLVERLMSHVMEIDNSNLRRGSVTDEIKEKIEAFKSIVSELPLLITDNIGYGMEEIDYLVRNADPQFDVVILDYIQLCRLGRFHSRVDAITEYLRAIKELCVKHDFAAVVLSQINRGATDRRDRRPMLQDLKGSGSLEEHADTVMLLYWPYNNEQQCEDKNRFEILVEKQRHGSIGRVEVDFHPEFSKFTDRSGVPMPPEYMRGSDD